MKIRQQLVTKNKQTYGGVNPLLGVVVHETGNTSRGANAAAHANLQTNGNSRDASWHITVDEKEAVQSYADTEQCWHAGDREANKTRLAVEICVNEDGDYDAAFRNAAEVVRMKRIEHGWSRANVEQHFDHSGKDCPSRIRAEGRWAEFLDLTEPEGDKTMSVRTPSEAIAWSKTQTKGYVGLCLVFVRSCFNIAVKYPSAAAAWAAAKKKHHTSSTASIPAGAPVFFDVPGNKYDHVALYLGGGLFRTNYSAKGTVITASLDHAVFNTMRMLGWTEDLNGVTIPGLAQSESAAKPTGGKYTGNSIVDYLASIGKDSSFASRKKLADQYGIKGYSGTSAQNTALLNAMRGGSKPAAKPNPAKSVAQMANEVIAGKHGSGHANRRKSLGISAPEYEKVRAEVNRRASSKAPAKGKSISQMATEVIQGKHGSGHANRQKSLGVSAAIYAKVRAEVNKRL